MKRFVFIILFIFYTVGLNAQSPILQSTKPLLAKHSIKLAPFNFLDPLANNFELSYERTIKKNQSFQFSTAYIFARGLDEFGSTAKKSRGLKLKFEARHYTRYEFSLKQYIAVELSHMYQIEDGRNFDFTPCQECAPDYDNSRYTDTISVVRNHTFINAKYGVVKYFSGGLILELYLGLGFKVRRVNHKERRNPEDKQVIDDGFFLPPSRRNLEGYSVVPSLPINVKIGHRF